MSNTGTELHGHERDYGMGAIIQTLGRIKQALVGNNNIEGTTEETIPRNVVEYLIEFYDRNHTDITAFAAQNHADLVAFAAQNHTDLVAIANKLDTIHTDLNNISTDLDTIKTNQTTIMSKLDSIVTNTANP